MTAEYLPTNPVAAADQLRSLASDLEVQEALIERGVQAFTKIGLALARIRDERLYRQEYVSFEVYCQTRWQLSRSRAYRLIDAATITEAMEAALEMSPMGDSPLPTSERQARELVGLTPEEAVSVIREANKTTDGRLTAEAIRNARNSDCGNGVDEDALTEELIANEYSRPISGLDGKTYQPRPQPKLIWSSEERELQKQIQSGETVVASLRGLHNNLIEWADRNGLYVRVDRRTEWGNPFATPDDGDRATVIANYENHYLPHKPSLTERAHELRGKALGCWCAPEPCHADVLKKMADQ